MISYIQFHLVQWKKYSMFRIVLKCYFRLQNNKIKFLKFLESFLFLSVIKMCGHSLSDKLGTTAIVVIIGWQFVNKKWLTATFQPLYLKFYWFYKILRMPDRSMYQ